MAIEKNYHNITNSIMMKNIVAVLFIVAATLANAQIYDPVEWTTSVKKVAKGEYELISTATIEAGWHLYSQSVPEDGPIPTSFFYDGEGVELVGETNEEEGHTVDDPVFEMRIKYFEDKAVFVQRVKGKKGTAVLGEVEFMVCDDVKCLPPTFEDLEFVLN